MKISFSKYHGTGNDFIIIDNRRDKWEPAARQVSVMCDRHLGIGADGMMLLSDKPGFDFSMTYFNSDGHESTMCGNGGRCITAFAKELGLIDKQAHFLAVDGPHISEISETGGVVIYRLKMKDTSIDKVYSDGIFLDTGSPHFVKFVDNAITTDVITSGRILRHDARFFPGGTNVDFVELTPGGLFVRTFERGVENETLSCGTGVVASAISAAYRSIGNQRTYPIKTPGGELAVSFIKTGGNFTDVWLEGPAAFVFNGEIEI